MRYERELDIFDYMRLEEKERSQAQPVLLAVANSKQEQAFNKVIDRQVKEKSKIAIVAPNLLECVWCQESFERWEKGFLKISCKECFLINAEIKKKRLDGLDYVSKWREKKTRSY